jgi:hypothetical protein
MLPTHHHVPNPITSLRHNPASPVQTVPVQVYVDESERHDYLLCAFLVRSDVGRLRRAVRAMCQPGQRRVHFAKESPARRRAVLSALTDLGVQARIYRSPNSVKRSRELCLDALVGDIAAAGAERLVIESRETMDHLDDRVIKAALRRIGTGELTFGHAGAHEEPLLWVPDAIVWAVGRGGDWRRRAEPLLEKVVDLGP